MNSLNFDDPKEDILTQKDLETIGNSAMGLENFQSVQMGSSNDYDKGIFGGMVPLRETHIFTSNDSNNLTALETNNSLSSNVFASELSSTFTAKSNPAAATITNTIEEDDFDDFQMVVPEEVQKPQVDVLPAEILKPVPAEPLKPTVVVQTPGSSINAAPAKIEWPDPGITEDDIRNIELSYRVNGQNANEVCCFGIITIGAKIHGLQSLFTLIVWNFGIV